MNCNTLESLRLYRQQLYGCFRRGRDALMDVCDALLTETCAQSLPELSLSPFFQRRWPSVYEAFEDAILDTQALQRLFVSLARQKHLSSPCSQGTSHGRLLLAADASSIVRQESRCARDRTYVHVPNLPRAARPVAPGWQFATVVALPESASSWTTILDNRRIPSDKTALQVVAGQLTELAPQLPEGTIINCDGSFGNPAFLTLTEEISMGPAGTMGLLLRTANNRVLYRRPVPPPLQTQRRGAPRKDGDAFSMREEATHGEPTAQWSGKDDRGNSLCVTAWDQLHFKKCRSVEVTLIRVQRPDIQEKAGRRELPSIWLIWCGKDRPPLEDIPAIYGLRYCIEQSFRFDKQHLLWQQPRLRTPEKFERWTWLVSAVHNAITLARPLAEAVYRPWEDRKRPPTPEQVRRSCRAIIAQLGTPASPPRVRGKSPGRATGAKIRPAERFPTIYKHTRPKKR